MDENGPGYSKTILNVCTLVNAFCYLLLFEDVVAFRKGGWFLSRQLLATDEVRTVAASLMQTARRFRRGGNMRYGDMDHPGRSTDAVENCPGRQPVPLHLQ